MVAGRRPLAGVFRYTWPVRVKARVAVEGQRNFVGVVREAGAGRLQLEVDGRLLTLEIGNLETARLVPDL